MLRLNSTFPTTFNSMIADGISATTRTLSATSNQISKYTPTNIKHHALSWSAKLAAASTTVFATAQDAFARPLSVDDTDGSWVNRTALAVTESLADHSIITGTLCLIATAAVIAIPSVIMLGGGGLLYRRFSSSLSDDAAKLRTEKGSTISLSRVHASQIGDPHLRKMLEDAKRRLQQTQNSVLSVGQVLTTERDKYEVMGFLGAGGMANVYLVNRVRDQTLVVFKQMQRSMAQREVGTTMFMDEIKRTRELTEKGVPHLVNYVDVLGDPFGVFLEYLPNGDVNELISIAKRDNKKIPTDQALILFTDIATCLVGLEANRTCHRDLKPENVFMYKDDQGYFRAKVGDLGLAKNFDGKMTEAPRGTPYFMSPEQFDNDADIRSDIYALGVIMYEAFTFKHPNNLSPTITKFSEIKKIVTSGEVVDLKTLRPDLPDELCDIVMQCLEKKPSDRFQHPAVLVKHLKMILKTLNPNLGDETFIY